MALEDFKRIVESLRTPVAVADSRGMITFANGAFAQSLGKAARELPGTMLADFFVAGDQKKLQQGLQRVAEGKSASGLLEAQVAGEEPRYAFYDAESAARNRKAAAPLRMVKSASRVKALHDR